ncbi:enoyl-CoA hydratase/isomerase family protein [Sedimentitalea sp. JM2-8]|uniref:Enoyl-CoA hydratase/isomerase family protein n=1 Tax=Sedimentitalea xiamensis TaxID=3050037 RepID=A0ABT7FCW6_9RHOB|nr:enoyl-CoA hydratase/isomerase family protein [Sedimentitalea xiamensis]MDK3072659.1 enoyl-CoA hydratase/isomerase family protein [Sedimentitalea xiamensis]
MTAEYLTRIDHEDGVVEIRLGRPPVNALSAAFLSDFGRIIDSLGADDEVRAIMLSSEFKVFSAGLDLKEAQKFDLKDQHGIVKGLNEGFLSLFACPKPTVVAVNGAAIAGGLFFVLASDFRLAAPNVRFGLAEIRVGADFPVGPLEIARSMLGPNALRLLMLTGLPVDSAKAETLGLIDEIVPKDALWSRTMAAAKDLAQLPPRTYASVKAQIRGETIRRIQTAIDNGANAPEGGWFNDETVPAMKRMIG